MVKLFNGESFFGDTYPSMVKCRKGEMHFAHWSELCCRSDLPPPGHYPGGQFSLDQKVSSHDIIPEDMYCGIIPGVFLSRYDT